MKLILVANPGSASRKYALFEAEGLRLRGELHFETEAGRTKCTLSDGKNPREVGIELGNITTAAREITAILQHEALLMSDDTIGGIGLRVVAPSAFFMQNHVMSDEVIEKLEQKEPLAPLHIAATLSELRLLREQFPDVPVVGVSDSAFHRTKPNYAWNYGINVDDADRFDIKRFGYHGISVGGAIDTLWNRGKLPPKVIVCHLGNGSSVSAVFHGRSIDTTMGFTPNEGMIMGTRSGNISPDATDALVAALDLNHDGLVDYLNHKSGLEGMAGTSDIRELLVREADGDHKAHLALTTLIHTIHKAIGSMLVAMNGCDMVVFTGTVGERSAPLRKRIMAHLTFADFVLDGNRNEDCLDPDSLTYISQAAKSKPIVVIPTNEAAEIAKSTLSLLQ